ncbi:MAG: methyltransferase [Flavisolibacter sp.]
MKSIIKYIVARTYRPLLVKYLSGVRTYTFKNIKLEIPPQVFHPGFFFSTKLLLKYVNSLPLSEKSFLELGAGSGLISIYAAKNGARVTAIDIHSAAIQALKKNRFINDVQFAIVQSDLFRSLLPHAFDIIAINPPYYKKQPLSDADYAWYCGEEGEYFQRLFKDLMSYVHASSVVLMILCDGCDIQMIKKFASENSFKMNCVFRTKNWLEENFIYQIERKNA